MDEYSLGSSEPIGGAAFVMKSKSVLSPGQLRLFGGPQGRKGRGIKKGQLFSFEHRKRISEARKADLSGNQFGDLVILKECTDRQNGNVLWECKCTLCGSIKTYLASNLRFGRSKSCGCKNGTFLEVRGKTFRVCEWAKSSGISQELILWRIANHWSAEDAVSILPGTLASRIENIEEAIELYLSGKTLKEVAFNYGYKSGSAIGDKFRQHGFKDFRARFGVKDHKSG